MTLAKLIHRSSAMVHAISKAKTTWLSITRARHLEQSVVSHHLSNCQDPAMFIINALEAVGSASKTGDFDRKLELTASKALVSALKDHIYDREVCHIPNPFVSKNNSCYRSPQASLPCPLTHKDYSGDEGDSVKMRLSSNTDLIRWDHEDIHDVSNISSGERPDKAKNSWAEYTISPYNGDDSVQSLSSTNRMSNLLDTLADELSALGSLEPLMPTKVVVSSTVIANDTMPNISDGHIDAIATTPSDFDVSSSEQQAFAIQERHREMLINDTQRHRNSPAEITANLLLQFDASSREAQVALPATALFTQLSTVVALLQSSLDWERSCTVREHHNQRQRRNDGPLGLHCYWKFLPSVIDIVRDDVTVQKMAVQYCLDMAMGDHSMYGHAAAYLSGKFGQEAFYEWCLQEAHTLTTQDWDESRDDESENKAFEDEGADVDIMARYRNRNRNTEPVPLPGPNDALSGQRQRMPSSLYPADFGLTSSPTPWTAPNQVSSEQFRSQQSWKLHYPNYHLQPSTSVIFIDQKEQLDQLRRSLSRSRVVGMDSQWVLDRPASSSQKKCRRSRYFGTTAGRIALLQLACDTDNCVYLIDTLAFLPDSTAMLPKLLGEFFVDPLVLKLVFDGRRDRQYLDTTFPLLNHRRYRLKNFIDLRAIWYKFENKSHGGRDHFSSTTYFAPTAWSTRPQHADLVNRGAGIHQDGSNTLWRHCFAISHACKAVCGKQLDTSQQYSDWDRRPLDKAQLECAATYDNPVIK
ncbi:Exonuclease mut-7 [Dissophora globulifera]|uniref:Exonuclease mut-7 n=1 Tax=Dissophora globulifera TaxID=979702 RepID=A0A9P6UTN2_9FUNG|nr:Exonuclease mut-7 [Dissophora globulifera]